MSENGAYTPNLSSKNGKTHDKPSNLGGPWGTQVSDKPKNPRLELRYGFWGLHGQAQLRLLLRLQTELLVQAGAPPWAQKTHVNGI